MARSKGAKGVDPLIAEVVLAIIVVSLGVIVFSQQSALFRQQQTRIQPVFNCAFAGAQVTDVIVSNSTGTVILRNTGQMPLQVTLQVFDVTGNQRPIMTPQPISLEVGRLASATFDMTGLLCQAFDRVSVFTDCENVRPLWASPAKCA